MTRRRALEAQPPYGKPVRQPAVGAWAAATSNELRSNEPGSSPDTPRLVPGHVWVPSATTRSSLQAAHLVPTVRPTTASTGGAAATSTQPATDELAEANHSATGSIPSPPCRGIVVSRAPATAVSGAGCVDCVQRASDALVHRCVDQHHPCGDWNRGRGAGGEECEPAAVGLAGEDDAQGIHAAGHHDGGDHLRECNHVIADVRREALGACVPTEAPVLGRRALRVGHGDPVRRCQLGQLGELLDPFGRSRIAMHDHDCR